MIDRDFLREYLIKRNYWWGGRPIHTEDKGISRAEYLQRLEQNMEFERVICVTGIRRCGKTTLLFQFIDKLLQKGTDPKKIVYVRVDELMEKCDDMRELVSFFQELSGINPARERVYFILDEIHFLPRWQFQLGYFIDTHSQSKFIISGSTKALLYKNASESLTGRIVFVEMFQLSFREFLGFQGVAIDAPPFFSEDTREIRVASISKAYHALLSNKDSLLFHLNNYLEVGGFPEWFKIKNMDKWYERIEEDYFSLILTKDILFTFKVRDPILLEKLALDVARFSAERFSYLNLAERVGGNRETVKQYLYCLSASSLLHISEVYFKTKKSREKLEKKLYFVDEGLRKAITMDKNEGRTAENVVAMHLYKYAGRKPLWKIWYWKNDHEVDFVIEGKQTIPLEVKYRQQPEQKGLQEFMDTFNCPVGILITRDKFDIVKRDAHTIVAVPLWAFLSMM